MFTIYKKDTGKILRVSGEDTHGSSEGSVAGEFSGLTHYVKAGVAIEIPPPPDPGLVFDYWVERWVEVVNQDTRSITNKRNRLLAESDWTQMPDVAFSTKDQWAAYRQALRDLTAQPGFPDELTWPTAPGSL